MSRSLVPLLLLAAWTFAITSTARSQQKPNKPQGEGGRRAAFEAPSYLPRESLWSRWCEAELPKDRVEASEEELARRFGFEDLGAVGEGAVRHYRHPRTGMLFVFVPGGTFRMGSNHADIYRNKMVVDAAARARAGEEYFAAEQPQLEIYVSPFFIGVYEVTNAEYRMFLAEWRAGRVDPDCEWPMQLSDPNHLPYLLDDPRFPDFSGDRKPVSGVSWLDGWAFCRWMGGRMPTEAEWEKAARGTDGRTFPWGNEFDAMRANTNESRNRRVLDVGTYPGGRSVYGCYDMAGNVGEYCVDSFEETVFRDLPKTNPCLLEKFPPGDKRAQRGGYWNRFGELFKARTTARGHARLSPQLPDPTRESKDGFPLTEYLSGGIRVVFSPLENLFPDDGVERLRAQARAISAKRAEANKRRDEHKGAKAPQGEASGDGAASDAPTGGGGVPGAE